MIGAPPGYVGYDEGGALTEAVRRRPYQVVLFDEVEKAHPDVFNVLLQVLDDGRLTDGQGRTVDFRNTLIDHDLEHGFGVSWPASATGTTWRRPARRSWTWCASHFRPEFLNRIDEIILFKRLGRARDGRHRQDPAAAGREAAGRPADVDHARRGALHWLADRGYDPVYGARPLKRVIQKELVDPIARKLLAGDLEDGAVINVSASLDGPRRSAAPRCTDEDAHRLPGGRFFASAGAVWELQSAAARDAWRTWIRLVLRI